MQIADLTPAERRVWWAFPRGETVDFRQAPDEDVERGDSWGPERTLRAEVLRALLLSGSAADGHVAALRVEGARIVGALDLRYGEVAWAVRLAYCHFEQAPELYAARVRNLTLSGSALPGLAAATIQVDGMLRLIGCRVDGVLTLGGARVSGSVFLDGARITGAAPSLRLDRVTAEGDLWARGLSVEGGVWLSGASVSGQINLDDADLRSDGHTALHAEGLTVGSDLHAMRLRCTGRLNLRGATVPGQLNLAYARLSNEGGVALRASSVTAGELWLREATKIKGEVNLRRARLGLLHISPEVWPAEAVRLEGMTFGTLAPHLPAKPRVAVLERDGDGYVPHSYEQLAAAYLATGDDKAARNVQLAKHRRRRSTLRLYGRVWGYLQDYTVGYGFRPMRAAGWLVALLLVGSVVYGAHHPPPVKRDEAPGFNPLFYTLDLLLPIIDFGQEKAFRPAGGHQWFAYALILAGWVLATTIVAGVTRTVSRS